MSEVKAEGLTTGGWAAAAPLLCVAHCLAAPVFVVVAPVLVENPLVEIPLMLIAAVVAVVLAAGGVRRHGETRVWIPIACGLLLWVGGVVWHAGWSEHALMVAGGLVLAGGMFWDARLRHRSACESCGCGG